jgi:hypothetical protein
MGSIVGVNANSLFNLSAVDLLGESVVLFDPSHAVRGLEVQAKPSIHGACVFRWSPFLICAAFTDIRPRMRFEVCRYCHFLVHVNKGRYLTAEMSMIEFACVVRLTDHLLTCDAPSRATESAARQTLCTRREQRCGSMSAGVPPASFVTAGGGSAAGPPQGASSSAARS